MTSRHYDGGRVTLTADGSCLGNPGPGGWAWVFDAACWAAGGHERTTNNLMELRAVYEALRATPRDIPLLIQTDSSYVIQVFTEWLDNWRSSGWKTASKKPVANRDGIEMIAAELENRDIKWLHVRGHSGHEFNELADDLARAAATAIRDGHQPKTGDASCIARRLARDAVL
ncbi:ribonuclease H family protein [Mycobacteroides abscessus]|uniref:ribonuclease H family protein n=1 Tax=Mycobacteroides abscessus TaxID=36809 RepID=UPI001F249D18|nr:ribonuclease H [Mycobacteroides abscessus]